jgi:anti-sigma factor ChrR (cupin superfamily)
MNSPEAAFPALAALRWKTTSWPGIRLHFLGQDAAANRAVLIAMDPHCAYPRHRHLGDEEVLVLSGSYHDAAGEYRAGEFVLNPAGSSHAAVAGPSGALLFARVPEGIETLEQPPDRR